MVARVDLGQGIIPILVYIFTIDLGKGTEVLKKREISKKKKADIRTLMKFVGIFCRENHNGEITSFSFKRFHQGDRKERDLCVRIVHSFSLMV